MEDCAVKNKVFIRAALIFSTLVLQVLFWTAILFVLGNLIDLLVLVLLIINLVVTINIIIENTYPENKIPWIIILNTIPIIGAIIYIVYGKQSISKKKKEMLKQIDIEQAKGLASINKPRPEFFVENPNILRQSEYIRRVAYSPAYEGTEVEYYHLGEEKWQAMLRELKTAEKFIFMEYFIIEQGKMWNEIEKILIEKAAQGVDVRLMYDDLGCLKTLPMSFAKRLRNHKIDCRVFNKFSNLFNANFNNRDHRKICVIDGNIGFVGGVNLADEYINQVEKFGHWKDTAVLFKGEAVYNLTVMFLSMWSSMTEQIEDYSKYAPTKKYKSDGIIQPYSDTPLDDDAVGENVYMSMLNCAKKYVYITTPYLIITREMMVSLMTAAKSGIDVRVMLPGVPDQKIIFFLSRSYYKDLLKAGVKIYEYTPGFIHSKMFVCDDETAVVGTINLDYRSLALHYECGAFMYKSSVVEKIKKDFLSTQESCKEITIENHPYQGRLKFVQFVLLGILRTFSPLL